MDTKVSRPDAATYSKARRRRSLGAVLAATAGGCLAAGLLTGPAIPEASALSPYSIVTKQIWRVGQPMPIRVNSVYADSCTLFVVGPTSTRAITLRPVRNRIVTSLNMPSGPAGKYQIQVACGRERARSKPFILVGPDSPLTATCRILEQGLSRAERDEATYGAVLVNDSPDLSATDVEISVISIDAGGNVIQTDTVYAFDVPPGQRILAATSMVEMPEQTRRYETTTRCSTSIDPVAIPAPATGRVASISDSYVELKGTFVNTATYTVDDYSKVAAIIRSADGRIVGGSTSYADSFVNPGGTGTWDALIWDYRGQRPVSVEAMIGLERARS